jgi:hypothetical protein
MTGGNYGRNRTKLCSGLPSKADESTRQSSWQAELKPRITLSKTNGIPGNESYGNGALKQKAWTAVLAPQGGAVHSQLQ